MTADFRMTSDDEQPPDLSDAFGRSATASLRGLLPPRPRRSSEQDAAGDEGTETGRVPGDPGAGSAPRRRGAPHRADLRARRGHRVRVARPRSETETETEVAPAPPPSTSTGPTRPPRRTPLGARVGERRRDRQPAVGLGPDGVAGARRAVGAGHVASRPGQRAGARGAAPGGQRGRPRPTSHHDSENPPSPRPARSRRARGRHRTAALPSDRAGHADRPCARAGVAIAAARGGPGAGRRRRGLTSSLRRDRSNASAHRDARRWAVLPNAVESWRRRPKHPYGADHCRVSPRWRST